MRHLKQKNSSFGRHRGPRKALLRGLIHSLVEQERIKTTLPKAKCARPLIEKAVTMGKRGDIHSRRLLFSRYPNKKTVDKIINNLSPRFKDRPGGYTRIIKLGFRSGDKAPLAYLEFVDYTGRVQPAQPSKKQKKTAKKGTQSIDTSKKAKKPDPKSADTDKKTDKKQQASKKTAADKKTDKKQSSTDKKQADKKTKKQQSAKTDKKRKKARAKQKQSRRINRQK